MNREQEAFLSAIKSDPRDELTRRAYADWLDEHDSPEEADFFRSWTLQKHEESEKWLEWFAKEVIQDEYYRSWNLELDLIQIGHDYLDGKGSYWLPFETPDEVHLLQKVFWKHFQTVTGRWIASSEAIHQSPFRCSC